MESREEVLDAVRDTLISVDEKLLLEITAAFGMASTDLVIAMLRVASTTLAFRTLGGATGRTNDPNWLEQFQAATVDVIQAHLESTKDLKQLEKNE